MRNDQLNVLMVCGTLLKRKGGAPRSNASLSRELCKIGCNVTILTAEYDDNDLEDCGKSKIVVTKKSKVIKKLIVSSTIVHFNEIWHPYFISPMLLCQKVGKPYIVTPRGSLMCLDINKTYVRLLKKYIAWLCYMKRNLVNAAGFHVTAKNELNDLKQFGFNVPVAVCSNGVNIEEFKKKTDKNLLRKLFPQTENKRILLFLSRIAPKKGLLLLAHAWIKIVKEYPDWFLLVVGPDDENYWPEIQSVLNKCDTNSYARSGYLSGEERLTVLQHSDLFVLPTYWENFGLVIAEALMSETPVITTTRTPWTDLDSLGLGWTIEPEQRALEQALKKAMGLDTQILQNMGRNGHEYVAKRYDWHQVAINIKEYYMYILGKRHLPEFVHQLSGTGHPKLPVQIKRPKIS